MAAKAIMFQGTGSSVGKSLLVAGFARALKNRGHSVRPFKPQNMSNNAAVTAGGGEIGRAQAFQARAAGVAATVDMNPVLLKPQAENGSQIIVRGEMRGTAKAREYQTMKPALLPEILESFSRLKNDADYVLVEGAGSAAEINLRENDIANMGFARAANVPVVVIGDIDRGGVIPSLVGIKSVVLPEDADMIGGFLVNKMRGDLFLFDDGMRFIADRTGWLPLGLVPYFDQASVFPDEDGLDLRERVNQRNHDGHVRIAVPMLPSISNFDDFDPLRAEPDVDLIMVPRGETLPAPCDLIILPGSKSTIADLDEFRKQGWDIDLLAHKRRGGLVLGICGGYQMLGDRIADPEGIEGEPHTVAGLGILQVETILTPEKQLVEVTGTDAAGTSVRGFEMHVGDTSGDDTARPAFTLADGRHDGAISKDGRVTGTYLHGLFGDDQQRAAWLSRLGGESEIANYDDRIEQTLDAFAAHLEEYSDIDALMHLAK
jgi:adenosylcobyric acid synthase